MKIRFSLEVHVLVESVVKFSFFNSWHFVPGCGGYDLNENGSQKCVLYSSWKTFGRRSVDFQSVLVLETH